MIGLPNYGLAIILMTFVIKAIIYPLTHKQMKSMRELQELQPKLKELQKRYADDPEKMQMETLKLYKEHGVNPLGGCLPLLIQMPILLAFYNALVKFHYVGDKSFLWVADLSKPDALFLLPILAGLTTYIQQRLSTMDANDPTQKSMLIVMPLMIAWMATRFAAGLALYWVMFNVLSILQQMYINYRSKPAVEAAAALEAITVESGERAKPDSEGTKGGKKHESGGKKRKKR